MEEEDAKLGVEDEVEFHGAEDVSPPHDDPDNEERAGSANGETAGMIVQLTTAEEDEAVGSTEPSGQTRTGIGREPRGRKGTCSAEG